MGKTGVGKSSLINILLNDTIAKVNDFDTGTYSIQKYSINKYGQNFNIYDTPGLFDPNIKMDKIFQQIGNLNSINVFLICYDISEKRFTLQDKEVFEILKYQYTDNIIKNSVIVFTKSNLVNINNLEEIAKNRYSKINMQVPMIYAYDNNTLEWQYTLWTQMIHKSKNPEFLIKAFDLKTRVCEPIKNILIPNKEIVYPSYTEKLIILRYNDCINNKNNNSWGFFGGLLALAGFIVLGALTGGAGLLGGLATLGGGSIAAGGLGIIGGTAVISTAGFLGGIIVAEMTDPGCKNIAITSLYQEINDCHYDKYIYENKQTAFEGIFCNNLPHGQGIVYETNGKKIWEGKFISGIPEICSKRSEPLGNK